MKRTLEEAATPGLHVCVLPLLKTLQQFFLKNLLATGTAVTLAGMPDISRMLWKHFGASALLLQ
jgi:hypothetical protein